jgi:hypothetical protein
VHFVRAKKRGNPWSIAGSKGELMDKNKNTKIN